MLLIGSTLANNTQAQGPLRTTDTREAATLQNDATRKRHVRNPKSASNTFTKSVLWYLPNRFMDFIDIFRARVKIGPGAAITFRVTDQAAFYAGNLSAFYFGLPGPRQEEVIRWPFGFERQRGVVIAGVDASDRISYPPRYGYSEANMGVHLGIAGVELGVDVFEIADFFAGWFCYDLGDDDYPKILATHVPAAGTVVTSHWAEQNTNIFLPTRPANFPSLSARFDYLEDHVPLRMQRQAAIIDQTFSKDKHDLIAQPKIENLSFSMYIRTLVGNKTEIEFKPDAEIDLDLPNLEHRLSLFVETASSDDLPGRDKLDREDEGLTFGVRDKLKQLHVHTDAGLRVKLPPELYARLSWRPEWVWQGWEHRFEHRLFWESEDGFGALAKLATYHWINDSKWWMFYNSASARITENSDGLEWAETLAIARINKLFDESKRKSPIGGNDTIEGVYLSASVFGKESLLTQYRTRLGIRQDFYREFVVLDYAIGLQWRKEEEWRSELRLDMGAITYF